MSFYRTQETRTDLQLLLEPRKTPSKKASQTAWRELLSSWDPGGKACTSEQRWSHLPLLASPAQTWLLQAGRAPVRSGPPPPAHSCSGAPASPFFSCGCVSRAACRGWWCSAAFRSPDSLSVLSRHSRRGMEQTNRTAFRANQPVILCGGLGPDHQTMSSQTRSSSRCPAVTTRRTRSSTSAEVDGVFVANPQ